MLVPAPCSCLHFDTRARTRDAAPAHARACTDNDCLGPTVTFPQMTIYDSLRIHNVSFGLYMNSTCGLDGKPCHGEDPHNPDSASAINTPDVAMAGVARHKDRFFSQETFYARAANGSLPQFAWLHPPIQACDHPCHDVAKGERLLKDVYEALRAGPKWESTLLLVVYDDAGGYYDHVVPPYEGVPADDAPCHLTGPHTDPPFKCPGGGQAFDFRRLGLRTSAMLIGAHVPKGAVFQEPTAGGMLDCPVHTSPPLPSLRRYAWPRSSHTSDLAPCRTSLAGPTPSSQFEITSVASSVKKLFNLTSFLTARDAWAAPVDELLLPQARTDTP